MFTLIIFGFLLGYSDHCNCCLRLYKMHLNSYGDFHSAPSWSETRRSIIWTNESNMAVCIFLTNKLLFLQDTSIRSFWHCCRCGWSIHTVIISKVCCLCLWRRFELWQYFKKISWAMSFWKFSLFAILMTNATWDARQASSTVQEGYQRSRALDHHRTRSAHTT